MSAIPMARSATGLSWATLLRGAAVAQCVGLAVAAVVLADAEAAVIAAATLVALLVLRFRERVGTAFLALMFADVAFFTAAAALTNLIELATPLATIGPGALAAIALPGLVASIASLARRDRARVRVRSASAVAVLAFAALAAVAIGALVTGSRASPAAAGVVRLETKNVSFSAAALSASAGTVTVRVANRDLFWHTFTIDALGVDLKVPVGGERQVTFAAAPGTYSYYCAVPGHSTVMKGTLTVR